MKQEDNQSPVVSGTNPGSENSVENISTQQQGVGGTNTTPQSQPQAFSQAEGETQQPQGVAGGTGPGDVMETVEQVRPKKRIPKIVKFLPLIFVVIFLVLMAIRFLPVKPSIVSKKGEIVWWGFREDEAVISPLIEEYQKKNPSIKVIYKKQSPIDYRERLSNALAGEQGPDIFEIHNSWVPMFRNATDIAPSSYIDKDALEKDFYPVIAKDLTNTEGVIGLPVEFDALALYVNDDIFASSAEVPPTTWNELRTLSEKLTQKDSNGILIQSGASLGWTSNIDHWQEIVALMVVQNEASLARPSEKRALDAIKYYEAFRKLNVWNDSFPPSTLAFARGDVAMYFGPLWRSYEISQINPSLKYHTVPLPQLPKNNPSDPNFTYASYWFNGVWVKSGNKDIAWDFLVFLTSEEALRKINENYKKEKGVERLYPRPAMNIEYKEHPLLGSVALFASEAESWYLVDVDNDGEAGINSQVNTLYNSLISPPKEPVNEVELELKSVLSSYGVK